MAGRPCLYLIDASIFIFRAWFSMPDNWRATNGYSTNAVAGYAGFLLQLLEREQPQAVFAAFDESLGSCFRNQIHPGYKASRALPDAALAYQLEACKRLTGLLGIALAASEQYEADDLLASAAVRARAGGMCVQVLTRDKDLGQILVDEDDTIRDFPKGEALNPSQYQAKHGIAPSQLADFLALTGDPIDDVPGVPGIGPRTAQQLLAHFGDLDALMSDPGAVSALPIRGARRIADLLLEHREQVVLARRLTGLVDDTDLNVDDWHPGVIDIDALAEFCNETGLAERTLKRFSGLAKTRAGETT